MATAKKPRPVRRRADVPDAWRNRIVDGPATVTAEELQAHPLNPRFHGAEQRGAIRGILDDIGWIAPIIVNRLTGRIIDGHMRVEEAAERGPIPVAWVELTEDEEKEALALFDPIGQMATYNPDALASLTEGMQSTVDMDDVLGGLLPSSATEPPEKPETVELKPLERGHVLISIPLDLWDEAADLLDQLGAIEGVTLASTVN
ncbi:hypothetical protein BH10ACT3_BH10ACT3_19880 [soil metagenome]